MSKRLWEKALSTSLKMKPARAWTKQQNQRETERAAARDATSIPHSSATVAWTDSFKFTKRQKNSAELMIRSGWQIYGVAFSLEERAYAIAFKHADGTYGVLYPTGELDRGVRWTLRKVDMWLARTKAAEPTKPVKAIKHKRPERESMPSNARQISRLYADQ